MVRFRMIDAAAGAANLPKEFKTPDWKETTDTKNKKGEIITAGIERTHAKWSTYFVTMVPDENYLDAASRLVVRDGVEM